MLDNILEMAEALGKQIYDSNLYQSYLYYKNKVENKTDLQQKIDTLKKMQLSQGIRRRQGEIVPLEEEEALSQVYSEVALDKDGLGFWESEKQLLLFMAEVLEIVTQQAPVDFHYAEEME